MPPRAGSRSIAGTGGRSGASSLRSSSHPSAPATTSARTSPPPWRRALEASSSKTSSSPSRASSEEAEDTDGCATRARRSERTRETTCMASSCQCQTSPDTEGTGAHGHVWPAGSSAIASPSAMPLLASPSRPLRRRGRVQARPTSILTDGVPARSGGPGLRIPGAPFHVILCRVEDLLRELSRVALVDRTLTDVLTDITRIAAQGIPGAESTSITLLRGEKAFTAAHHGEMALAADELQYAHGLGPCMDAGRGGVLLRVDDMRIEERWPEYVAHVRTATPVLSSLSVPLPYQGSAIGALNNYATKPNAFASPESLRAATDVAEVIAVAVANADAHAQLFDQARNMRIAMESRAVIEQAKGVLMAQRHIDADQAFEILREASQRYNRKLRDIAAGIVDSATESRPR